MIRALRNLVVIIFAVIAAIIACLYTSAFGFIYFCLGADYWDPYKVKDMILVLQYYVVYYLNYGLQYGFGTLDLQANNFFIAKLLASILTPFSIAGILSYIFREQIAEWRPYKKKESVHGDARWASEKDIKKAGLRAKKGLMLGQDKKGYFIASGFQHALLFAPTGSGKGVGFVIPNLLFWEESVIVHDIKLENFDLTSGWRKKRKQKVYLWAPADPDGHTHCYNPLDWISNKPGQMVDDVQKIANLILPEKEFWQNEARSLFVGVVLYLLAVPEKTKSFGEVVRTMRSDDVVYNLAVVLDTIGKYIHPVAYMNIAAFLQKADKERSGVISTMNSGLELWANPLIDTATATSDFNIQNFKKERTTVYVGLTPDNIKRLEPLMQVFYQQATEFLTRKIPNKKEEPYGVLFMMDEFPTLGKMEQFKTGIAYFRGYNVRLFLIIQDTEQLKGTYEEAGMNSFLSNSTYRVTFAANNMETANLISQLCGNKTVEQTSQNKPKFLDFNPASRSLHVSEVQRALLLPQEVILLPRDEQIVLIESFPPIKSKKIKYFDDRFFRRRLYPSIKVPTQEPFDPRKFAKSAPVAPAEQQQQAAPQEEYSAPAGIEHAYEEYVEENTNINEDTNVVNDNSDNENKA
jgi:type IV secretion system protein VirD4